MTTRKPLVAKSISAGACKHGTVYVELFDAAGKKFAIAPLDPVTARRLAARISDAADKGSSSEIADMVCEGHA